jgi:hypothetical protein
MHTHVTFVPIPPPAFTRPDPPIVFHYTTGSKLRPGAAKAGWLVTPTVAAKNRAAKRDSRGMILGLRSGAVIPALSSTAHRLTSFCVKSAGEGRNA